MTTANDGWRGKPWDLTNEDDNGRGKLVKVLWGSGEPVDLTDLEALCDLLPETGIFTRKPRPDGSVPGVAGAPKDPVDVDGRLANMRLRGPGDSAVHTTVLQVSASELRRGIAVEVVVDGLLDEVCAAVEAGGETWNGARAHEHYRLTEMCLSHVRKNPELSGTLPEDLRDDFEMIVAKGGKPLFRYDRRCGDWRVVDKSNDNGLKVVAGTDTDGDADGDAVAGEARRPYRFKLVAFGDLRPGPEPLYLVDELIPVAGLVDVWGKAKCYKSFWCLDLMLHVVMGWEYRDRYTRQGAVVYCAFEGAHGYKKRIEALRRHYNITADAAVPLYVMPGQANLIAEHRVLIADIAAQLGEVIPAAVVLDTLNKSLFGSENKDIDMGNYVRAAEAIRDRFNCVVIIIHHCGYDDTRPRGHSSLPGAVDAQLSVVRAEDIITVTVEMMRDGPEDTQVVSAVEVVDVGDDQNGKTLTSLVVVPSEADPVASSQGLPRGLTVFDAALKAALATHGAPFQPEPGVVPVRAVSQWVVRDYFYKTYADLDGDAKKRQAKMQRAFLRAMGDAQSRGMLKVRHLESGQTMMWKPGRNEGF